MILKKIYKELVQIRKSLQHIEGMLERLNTNGPFGKPTSCDGTLMTESLTGHFA